MADSTPYELAVDGGDEEDRTPDLRIANATLSQLSYVPTLASTARRTRAIPRRPLSGMNGRQRKQILKTQQIIQDTCRTPDTSTSTSSGRVTIIYSINQAVN
jgi:hypothetical protein